MKTNSKGFTLIELLVVIAIIGILSSIVLASLSSARTKGEDVAIQSTLSSMRTQAELFYSNNSNYGSTTATAMVNVDNACDIAALGNTIFAIPSTVPGSVLNLMTDLKLKASNANNVACAVIPTAATTNVTAWAVAARMKTGGTSANFWCVDSAGTSKQVNFVTTTVDAPEETITAGTATCI